MFLWFVIAYYLSLSLAVDEPLKKTFQVRLSFTLFSKFACLFSVWMMRGKKLKKMEIDNTQIWSHWRKLFIELYPTQLLAAFDEVKKIFVSVIFLFFFQQPKMFVLFYFNYLLWSIHLDMKMEDFNFSLLFELLDL